MRKIVPVIAMLVVCGWSCSPPECIYCDINGYPQGEICRDTYETTLLPGTPSWRDFTEEALKDGCTKEP